MSATQSQDLPLWVQEREKVIANSIDNEWRGGNPPDYSESDRGLATESQANHPQGSLAALVENLVRNFELEASFKTDTKQWLSVVNDKFRMSSNGGEQFTAEDVSENGTYNLFIGEAEEYKASEENFLSSGRLFRSAFPKGFLWEVLEVYSSPPNVTFKWRHWGTFNGPYKDYAPTGEVVEIIGMSIASVTDDLKIDSVEHYFDNSQFFAKLTSNGKHRSDRSIWSAIKRLFGREKQTTPKLASSCPFKKLASSTNFSN
ncbi:SnoaL-like polyketide cyclase [Rivularia sp. UHCC 0363]|uniref:SnoaL-like polyketide cyclase n=1 Tax=Rivularia sp. UHCC 0363 TaxID=3110244 RepID=UPI002B215F08|nr:SnoaL-like polyketide cyclase [Rivularia sp. UHCC 0363]MEA5594995.1 SnoaL-like polyketide cyclase [Rivularia sp. UHCC 0363]